MSSISIKNSSFSFTDNNNREHSILDLKSDLLNKSNNIRYSEDPDIIFQILLNTIDNHKKLFQDNNCTESIRYFLIDALAASFFVQFTNPFKIAELGATDGILTYNLAELTGKLDPASKFYIISNINNESNYLDAISNVSQQPVYSMLFSDCSNTGLQSDSFDIVILNGNEKFDDPYNVIKEAVRITRNGGIIICCSMEDCLLESSFKLIFSERNEYPVSDNDIIMTSVKSDNIWHGSENMS